MWGSPKLSAVKKALASMSNRKAIVDMSESQVPGFVSDHVFFDNTNLLVFLFEDRMYDSDTAMREFRDKFSDDKRSSCISVDVLMRGVFKYNSTGNVWERFDGKGSCPNCDQLTHFRQYGAQEEVLCKRCGGHWPAEELKIHPIFNDSRAYQLNEVRKYVSAIEKTKRAA
jgi:hypothetical protein